MKENKFFLNPHCLFRQVNGATVISNPVLRYHVEIEPDLCSILLRNCNGLSEDNWIAFLENQKGRDRTEVFVGKNGLVTDHSGFIEKAEEKFVTSLPLLNLLRDRLVLIEDFNLYMKRKGPLENLFDRNHLGTFHQRVGQYVLLQMRSQETWRAWQNQKFSPDGKTLIGGNYRQIQEPFFDRRYTQQNLKGKRILDFGCGNGYFSIKFAQAGAQVTAMDSSDELIALARSNYGKMDSLHFKLVSDMDDSVNFLRSLESNSYDLIYLQDTLLLLLNPEDGTTSIGCQNLFNEFRRLVAPRGELCMMEPNALFWLASRYGPKEAPYAIISEYLKPVFNVVPPIGKMISPLVDAGFALVEYSHPDSADREYPEYAYTSEFPVWDFFRFKVMGENQNPVNS